VGYVENLGFADKSPKRSKWFYTDLSGTRFTSTTPDRAAAFSLEEQELPVTLVPQESHSLIRLEGEFNIASAVELKQALLAGLGAGTDLHLDLEPLANLDITAMQLFWAAGKEAARTGVNLVIPVTEAAARAAREAGFEMFPGLAKEICLAIEG
jgi:anti-anti-sigma regulatory factor